MNPNLGTPSSATLSVANLNTPGLLHHRSHHHLFIGMNVRSLSNFRQPRSHFRSRPGQLIQAYHTGFSCQAHANSTSILTGVGLLPFDERLLIRSFGYFSEHLAPLNSKGVTAHPNALLSFVRMSPKPPSLPGSAVSWRRRTPKQMDPP